MALLLQPEVALDQENAAVYTLPLGHPEATLENVGGKGASLARLAKAGLPVPAGFHVTIEAYRRFVSENNLQAEIQGALDSVDVAQPATLETASRRIGAAFQQARIPAEIASAIVHAYSALPGPAPAVAVRSSATAEDLPEASFAGQQDTYLNVSGAEATLDATRRCWASLWTARAISYRARQGIAPDQVALAVVVQLLVPSEAAGILFTANPVNGARHEATISAAWGLGEAIVGGAVTPDTFVVDKASGRIVSREIADKQVMTVRVEGGGTQERPVPDNLRRAPALDEATATELTRLGAQIERLYGTPLDIEWAWCDDHISIVQARPITALAEAPIEWKLPNPKGVYMRASVVDLTPEPLSPLFVSLGIPALKKQMYSLGTRLTRSRPVLPDDYYTSINNYAYMNATMPARSWWWIVTGLLRSYPRLLRIMVPFWREELLPEYQAFVTRQQDNAPGTMTTGELWRSAQAMVDAAMYYVAGLLFATMGASAGSEGLLTKAYDKLAKRDGDPPATVLLMGWNNIPVRAEKSLYDMALWCRERETLAAYLTATPSRQLVEQLPGGQSPAGVDAEEWQEVQARFAEHLKQFGHIVFQLDFAEPLPLDDPSPMLENVKMYLRGGGVNPHERQRVNEAKRVQTADTMLRRLRGLKRWAFRKALNWGQSLAQVREDALAQIGLGYPMLRAMLHELGQRFVAAGAVREANDIFCLEKDEIEACVTKLESGAALADLSDRVTERKAFLKKAARVTPPPMMPLKKRVMGVKTEVFVAATGESQTGNTLKGVATSAGKVTAPACVLCGPEDFDQMRPGDVLVASTTTPAWTPLFAMASAVVTDIGGPLSHGSIVAREYGIPAVMGTGVATKRIRSGQIITVDGSAGMVTLT
jgi:pyruvate,water dikinase